MVQHTQPLARLTTLSLPHHQLGVDVDRAEIVDEHCHPKAVTAVQYAIEQCGFPCTEEPGQDGDGNYFGISAFHVAPSSRQSVLTRRRNAAVSVGSVVAAEYCLDL